MFVSTVEKQLDAKRRLVVPADFRAAAGSGPFAGVFCFPSIEADCLEGGGRALYDRNLALLEEFQPGDPLRSALELQVLGGQETLAFDSAGRITLPETLCEQFGLSDWVAVVGLGDRFQIWNRDSFRAHREQQRQVARDGLAQLRQAQRAAKLPAQAAA